MVNRENNPYKTFKILSRIFSLIALIMIGILIFGTARRGNYIETDAQVVTVDSRIKTDSDGENYIEYYAHILYTIENKEYESYYTIWGPNSLTLPIAKARGFSLTATGVAEQSFSGSSH